MSLCFIDANIIVYANDCRDKVKQDTAIKLIAKHIRDRSGAVSVQVLQEYAATAINKLSQKTDVVMRQIRLLESLRVVTPSAGSVIRTVEIHSTYSISFWDAAIIAAAEVAECEIVLSEDMNSDQYYCGIKVVNPLRPF